MPKSTLCRRCGEQRHYTGTRWRCSRCYNDWQQNKRRDMTPEQYAAYRAQANRNRKASRARLSPEKRAEVNAAVAAWRRDNPEKCTAGHRDYYARNAVQIRAQKLAEYRAKPEVFYARNLVRKARLAGAVCDHGPKCVGDEFLAAVYASECFYCGEPAEHADHFYPIARGGMHCVENIVPACQPCNNSKCARDPLEFIASRS